MTVPVGVFARRSIRVTALVQWSPAAQTARASATTNAQGCPDSLIVAATVVPQTPVMFEQRQSARRHAVGQLLQVVDEAGANATGRKARDADAEVAVARMSAAVARRESPIHIRSR